MHTNTHTQLSLTVAYVDDTVESECGSADIVIHIQAILILNK